MGIKWISCSTPAFVTMQLAFDVGSIRKILHQGVSKGYWSVDDLDVSTESWKLNTLVDPDVFPKGYIGVQHQNLLRDYQPEKPVAATKPSNFTTTPVQSKDITDDPF